MADRWIIAQEIDLQRGIQAPQYWPNVLMVCGDEGAHSWRVRILDGGAPSSITGTIIAYFVRGDGATVTVNGEMAGNVATVTLPRSCYSVEGDMTAVMQLHSEDGMRITLSALVVPVRRMTTDVIVDEEHIIPSLADLLTQIERMENGAQAAQTAAEDAAAAAEAANLAASEAGALAHMTIAQQHVPYGTGGQPTIEVDAESGAYTMTLQIERGPQGPGYVIKGSAYASVAALSVAISNPAIGDQYNVGSAPPYNVYRWTGTQWEDQGVFASLRPLTPSEVDAMAAAIAQGGTPDPAAGSYLGMQGLAHYAGQVRTALASKVDKVTGKGLSTNDYTDADAAKLAALENTRIPKVSGAVSGNIPTFDANGSITDSGVSMSGFTRATFSLQDGTLFITTEDYIEEE